jgi:transcriptional regulator with XRE-family HTH domain
MAEADGQPTFAVLLRQFRAEAELTQEALAEAADISPRNIQKLERGESQPYLVTVQRLARALGLNAEQRARIQAAGRTERRPSAEPPPGSVSRPAMEPHPAARQESLAPVPSQPLDPHLEAVSRAIAEGRLVLFLGEQVNLCGRSAGTGWEPGRTDVVPTGEEMAAHLARSFAYPAGKPADLVRVAQYVSVMQGAGPLYDAVHDVLDADYRANAVHELVARLPGDLRRRGLPVRYPLVVTTNYDDTLERAFAQAEEPFDLVVYAAEGELRGKFWHQLPDGRARLIDRPNKYLGLPLDERTVILKIYGAVDRADAEQDSFVISEDDYLDFLTRADISNLVPVTLAARLRKSHYLFLGYSLRDWNLRVILQRLWGEQRLVYKSWAVQVHPDVLDWEFWRKRDVDLLGISLDEYVGQLHARLAAPEPV